MLLPEAVIAELLGALIIGYSAVKRMRSAEGYALAILVFAVVLLVAVPITAEFIS